MHAWAETLILNYKGNFTFNTFSADLKTFCCELAVKSNLGSDIDISIIKPKAIHIEKAETDEYARISCRSKSCVV